MPERIQRQRTAGWRMPEGAVSITRPGPWGNPCKCDENGIPRAPDGTEIALSGLRAMPGGDWRTSPMIAAMLVEGFRHWITQPEQRELLEAARRELAGKDLACWCPLQDHRSRPWPCHGDVWIELVNGGGHG